MLKKLKSSYLNFNAKIILHTRLAQTLFNYSWQHGKMGLLQFAKSTSTLWKAANADDPYADWILFKTYEALLEAKLKIKLQETHLTEELEKIRGIESTPALNAEPMKYSLEFSNMLAYMGAGLLTDVDYVIRQILTLKRLGLAIKDDVASINRVVKVLQDVFAIPRQWQHTGVTRQDFQERNQVAKDAVVLLGEVPDYILEQKIDFNDLGKYVKEK